MLCISILFLVVRVFLLTSSRVSSVSHQLHSLHLCYLPQQSSVTNQSPLYLNSWFQSLFARSSQSIMLVLVSCFYAGQSSLFKFYSAFWFCFPCFSFMYFRLCRAFALKINSLFSFLPPGPPGLCLHLGPPSTPPTSRDKYQWFTHKEELHSHSQWIYVAGENGLSEFNRERCTHDRE